MRSRLPIFGADDASKRRRWPSHESLLTAPFRGMMGFQRTLLGVTLFLCWTALPADGRAVRLKKRAAFYIANDTVCNVDGVLYRNGDPIPTEDPCETCKCRPPGFACVLKECEVKPHCKAVRKEGKCCPDYQCGCEQDGQVYDDGDVVPSPHSPCYVCYCQGSSISCSLVACHFRTDCEPRYVPGECCPRYDHCPPPEDQVPSTTPKRLSWLTTTSMARPPAREQLTTAQSPRTTTVSPPTAALSTDLPTTWSPQTTQREPDGTVPHDVLDTSKGSPVPPEKEGENSLHSGSQSNPSDVAVQSTAGSTIKADTDIDKEQQYQSTTSVSSWTELLPGGEFGREQATTVRLTTVPFSKEGLSTQQASGNEVTAPSTTEQNMSEKTHLTTPTVTLSAEGTSLPLDSASQDGTLAATRANSPSETKTPGNVIAQDTDSSTAQSQVSTEDAPEPPSNEVPATSPVDDAAVPQVRPVPDNGENSDASFPFGALPQVATRAEEPLVKPQADDPFSDTGYYESEEPQDSKGQPVGSEVSHGFGPKGPAEEHGGSQPETAPSTTVSELEVREMTTTGGSTEEATVRPVEDGKSATDARTTAGSERLADAVALSEGQHEEITSQAETPATGTVRTDQSSIPEQETMRPTVVSGASTPATPIPGAQVTMTTAKPEEDPDSEPTTNADHTVDSKETAGHTESTQLLGGTRQSTATPLASEGTDACTTEFTPTTTVQEPVVGPVPDADELPRKAEQHLDNAREAPTTTSAAAIQDGTAEQSAVRPLAEDNSTANITAVSEEPSEVTTGNEQVSKSEQLSSNDQTGSLEISTPIRVSDSTIAQTTMTAAVVTPTRGNTDATEEAAPDDDSAFNTHVIADFTATLSEIVGSDRAISTSYGDSESVAGAKTEASTAAPPSITQGTTTQSTTDAFEEPAVKPVPDDESTLNAHIIAGSEEPADSATVDEELSEKPREHVAHVSSSETFPLFHDSIPGDVTSTAAPVFITMESTVEEPAVRPVPDGVSTVNAHVVAAEPPEVAQLDGDPSRNASEDDPSSEASPSADSVLGPTDLPNDVQLESLEEPLGALQTGNSVIPEDNTASRGKHIDNELPASLAQITPSSDSGGAHLDYTNETTSLDTGHYSGQTKNGAENDFLVTGTTFAPTQELLSTRETDSAVNVSSPHVTSEDATGNAEHDPGSGDYDSSCVRAVTTSSEAGQPSATEALKREQDPENAVASANQTVPGEVYLDSFSLDVDAIGKKKPSIAQSTASDEPTSSTPSPSSPDSQEPKENSEADAVNNNATDQAEERGSKESVDNKYLHFSRKTPSRENDDSPSPQEGASKVPSDVVQETQTDEKTRVGTGEGAEYHEGLKDVARSDGDKAKPTLDQLLIELGDGEQYELDHGESTVGSTEDHGRSVKPQKAPAGSQAKATDFPAPAIPHDDSQYLTTCATETGVSEEKQSAQVSKNDVEHGDFNKVTLGDITWNQRFSRPTEEGTSKHKDVTAGEAKPALNEERFGSGKAARVTDALSSTPSEAAIHPTETTTDKFVQGFEKTTTPLPVSEDRVTAKDPTFGEEAHPLHSNLTPCTLDLELQELVLQAARGFDPILKLLAHTSGRHRAPISTQTSLNRNATGDTLSSRSPVKNDVQEPSERAAAESKEKELSSVTKENVPPSREPSASSLVTDISSTEAIRGPFTTAAQ